jgi:hypothetical protein
MFQLASVAISAHLCQLCGSCGADKMCVSTSRRFDVCSDPSSQLSLEMKRDDFNVFPKANNEAFDGNSRHLHDPNKFACRNYRLRQCSSVSSVSGVLFTLNSFHKTSHPSLLYEN